VTAVPGRNNADSLAGTAAVHPDRFDAIQREQRRAHLDGHTLACRELCDDAGDRRSQRHARLDGAGLLDAADLFLGHAGLTHAVCGRVDERSEIRPAPAQHGEIFLLRGDPIRDVDVGERLARGDAVETRANAKPLDVAGRARLHENLRALVELDVAGGPDCGNHLFAQNVRRADADVLLDARADRYRALVAGVRIDRH
jgi:hypothetical protein